MDCLIIGFNELNLDKIIHEHEVMQKHSGAYRQLLHSVVRFQDEWMNYTDVFNSIVSDAMEEPVHLHLMRMPNLAVCYLKSYLAKRQFDVDTVNFYNVEKERFEDLLRLKPTAAAITTTYYISTPPVTELVRHIRSISPETKIIVGGPYISQLCNSSPDTTTQDFILEKMDADIYVNSAQGEHTLAAVLDALRGGKRALHSVPNLIISTETAVGSQPHGHASFIRTPLEIENNSMDKNCIDWSLFSKSFYTPVTYMRTARGCPFACAFCSFPSLAGELTYTSIDIIEKEMKQLSEAGVRYLMFIDDAFNVPLVRFKEILKMMISHEFNFNWVSYFRCSHADDETYELMQKSGCRGVFLGIESGDQHMLDNMNKKVKVEQYKTGIRNLHKRGIFTFISIIVGFPGETEQSVQKTIEFLQDARPTFMKAELYFHAHHVPIHKEAERYGIRGSGYGWRHNTMDWQTAGDQLERMYDAVQETLICPIYLFDFWTIPYFLSNGVSLDQIKRFLHLCKPLLQRNIKAPAGFDEDQTYGALYKLGKDIAGSIENL